MQYFGKLLGLMQITGATVQFLQFPLLIWAEDDSFVKVSYLDTITMITWYMFYWIQESSPKVKPKVIYEELELLKSCLKNWWKIGVDFSVHIDELAIYCICINFRVYQISQFRHFGPIRVY